MITSEQSSANQSFGLTSALKVLSDRDRLLVVAKRVLAELDNIYDVDQEIGNDCVHTKEFPFSGAGELMTMLRVAIEKAEAQ